MMCCSAYEFIFFFFKQKTAYEMRISDWSSDVCSSDLLARHLVPFGQPQDLPAQSGEAAVVAIELVDQLLDLGVVEVDGLHHFRQLFAQLLEAMLDAVADVLAIGQRAEAAVLKAGALDIDRNSVE